MEREKRKDLLDSKQKTSRRIFIPKNFIRCRTKADRCSSSFSFSANAVSQRFLRAKQKRIEPNLLRNVSLKVLGEERGDSLSMSTIVMCCGKRRSERSLSIESLSRNDLSTFFISLWKISDDQEEIRLRSFDLHPFRIVEDEE